MSNIYNYLKLSHALLHEFKTLTDKLRSKAIDATLIFFFSNKKIEATPSQYGIPNFIANIGKFITSFGLNRVLGVALMWADYLVSASLLGLTASPLMAIAGTFSFLYTLSMEAWSRHDRSQNTERLQLLKKIDRLTENIINIIKQNPSLKEIVILEQFSLIEDVLASKKNIQLKVALKGFSRSEKTVKIFKSLIGTYHIHALWRAIETFAKGSFTPSTFIVNLSKIYAVIGINTYHGSTKNELDTKVLQNTYGYATQTTTIELKKEAIKLEILYKSIDTLLKTDPNLAKATPVTLSTTQQFDEILSKTASQTKQRKENKKGLEDYSFIGKWLFHMYQEMMFGFGFSPEQDKTLKGTIGLKAYKAPVKWKLAINDLKEADFQNISFVGMLLEQRNSENTIMTR